MQYLLLLSATPSGAEGGSGSVVYQLGFFALIFVIFWLLLIRPQQKKAKEHKNLLATLKKGDRVVTNSGMFGVISSINEEKSIIVLKVAENVKVEQLKSSIAGKVE